MIWAIVHRAGYLGQQPSPAVLGGLGDDRVQYLVRFDDGLEGINALITDVQRNGNEGIGKPEPLKHGFQGYWSRRITDEHRLVYKVIDDEIRIAACRYHYER